MAELDKVIKGINCHIKKDCRGNACPYADVYACEFVLLNDALELLKKDEVKPEIEKAIYDIDSWHYVCGECRTPIDRIDLYCRGCGKTLKWD